MFDLVVENNFFDPQMYNLHELDSAEIIQTAQLLTHFCMKKE